MPIPAAAFRDAMSRLASAVTVLSVRDAEGRGYGMTASAVCSLSLEPPMILACVDRDALIHDWIIGADVFGVSVLAEDQRGLAERFADRATHAMTDTATTPAGLPLVPGALVHLECRRAGVLPGGDHAIVTGVVEWSVVRDGPPLAYFRSGYTGLAR